MLSEHQRWVKLFFIKVDKNDKSSYRVIPWQSFLLRVKLRHFLGLLEYFNCNTLTIKCELQVNSDQLNLRLNVL